MIATGLDVYGVGVFVISGENSPGAIHPAEGGANILVGGASFYNPALGIIYFGLDVFYPGGREAALNDRANLERQNQAILGQGWRIGGLGGISN